LEWGWDRYGRCLSQFDGHVPIAEPTCGWSCGSDVCVGECRGCGNRRRLERGWGRYDGCLPPEQWGDLLEEREYARFCGYRFELWVARGSTGSGRLGQQRDDDDRNLSERAVLLAQQQHE